MNWKRKKKFLVHHWQMSVSFKVKDEIQFPPFYGQYFMYYFQLCLKGGGRPAGAGALRLADRRPWGGGRGGPMGYGFDQERGADEDSACA